MHLYSRISKRDLVQLSKTLFDNNCEIELGTFHLSIFLIVIFLF